MAPTADDIPLDAAEWALVRALARILVRELRDDDAAEGRGADGVPAPDERLTG